MKVLKIILSVLFFLLLNSVHSVKSDGFQNTLGHLKTKTSETVQTQAVEKLIRRIIPDRALQFNVVIDKKLGPIGKDTFKVEKLVDKIKITGSSGVAAAWGFHYFLKSVNAHISWESVQLKLPIILPDINITITSNDRFRYYQNVCTTSYSFTWWNWRDWEKHIDWMALNGFNLVLAFNGQEEIWRRVYTKFGLTKEDIDDHFTGPAFFAWNRMGNMRKFGGPLSENWHKQSIFLQKKILKRMREFGILPVLPAFAGHVPQAFKRLYPEASTTKMNKWNHFEDGYCCPLLLDPTDDLFNIIGVTFMQEQIAEFGTDHVYNCDTFNEMVPTNGNLDYLKTISSSIYSAMTKVDPHAIWILQNWLFKHEILFWTHERVKALLTGVPIGRMIVLDLQSEQFPQYERLNSYFGQPFIWNMLHNFGGTLGMFGSLDRINENVFKGRNFENTTMIGTGLTPEGINQNYVVYDLMMEMFWRKQSVDIDKWIEDYTIRRYGMKNFNAIQAWKLLSSTVYNYTGNENMRGKYAISRSPKLNIYPNIWYDVSNFMNAWDFLLKASDELSKNTGYRHDLVDVTRQALQILGDLLYPDIVQAFRKKNVSKFQNLRDQFLFLFKDLDSILSSNEAFLLGNWLSAAKSHAMTEKESEQYEYNARNQISLWGPRGEINDYANKQWAGVVSDLFGARWSVFLFYMNESLTTKTRFNESCAQERVFTLIEKPFTFSQKVYPSDVIGDSVIIAREIHETWRNVTPSEQHMEELLLSRPQNKNGKNKKGRKRKERSSGEVMAHIPEVIVTIA